MTGPELQAQWDTEAASHRVRNLRRRMPLPTGEFICGMAGCVGLAVVVAILAAVP